MFDIKWWCREGRGIHARSLSQRGSSERLINSKGFFREAYKQ
jgi:hypothetical protein